MTRILLLSVSAGAGRGRAAEVLRAEAAASFSGVEAKHIAVMTWVPSSFRAIGRLLLVCSYRVES